jgi:hypothetical protein
LACGRGNGRLGMLSCPRGGMVDTGDLKSLGRKAVPVRVRPRAPSTL